MILVIKLFPEIITKSKSVRKNFIGILRKNLKNILQKIEPDVSVIGFWDKIEVNIPEGSEKENALLGAIKNIPGIDTILIVDKFSFQTTKDIEDKVEQNCCKIVENKSFVVRVKRTGTHDFKSVDIERQLGGVLRRKVPTCRVDLHNPEETIMLEVKDDKAFIVSERINGMGGFPIGTQSDVLSLISGGFDSTVASYKTIRRGLKTHYLFFSLGGKAHETGVKQVSQFLWEKYGSSHKVKFITIPFEDVIGEILAKVKNSHMGVILKRMMLRAATEVARQMGIDAIVTGECIAQVSSQTLRNLAVIDDVTNMLVLRPIVTMDKNDIIDIARAIGTEPFVKNIPEYCGVISDRPTVKATHDETELLESEFDMQVLEDAIQKAKIENIDKVFNVTNSKITSAAIVSVPNNNEVIIDLRYPLEDEDKLKFANNEVINIPFYAIEKRFNELDQNQQYLLYCDKGLMSELHASNLIDNGFGNVKVLKY